MKKTFPIITVLITISLLGLIFFQVMWLKSVKVYREQRLKDNVTKAAGAAGLRLSEEKKFFSLPKQNDNRLSGILLLLSIYFFRRLAYRAL